MNHSCSSSEKSAQCHVVSYLNSVINDMKGYITHKTKLDLSAWSVDLVTLLLTDLADGFGAIHLIISINTGSDQVMHRNRNISKTKTRCRKHDRLLHAFLMT